MIDFNIDGSALATLTLAVISFVELYKRLIDKDWKVAGIIAVSGLSGAVFASQVGDLTWFTGMLIGFSGSGVITTASYLGGKKNDPLNITEHHA
jgi:hypothetical protein